MATKKNLESRADLPAEVKSVGPSLPTYLAAIEEDRSLDLLAEHRIIPRLKIIQAMTGSDLKKEFGEGAVIVSPGNTLVVEAETSFSLVPVFFYPEWIQWADINDKSSQAIVARSTDSTSEIAVKSRDANKRHELYDAQRKYSYRFVEHFNFIAVIYGDHPLAGQVVALSFARGEHGTGRNFISAVFMRKAPLWAQVWNFSSGVRKKNSNEWYGFNYSSPEQGSQFIREDEVEKFQSAHKEMKLLFEKSKVSVDQSGAEDEELEASVVGTKDF